MAKKCYSIPTENLWVVTLIVRPDLGQKDEVIHVQNYVISMPLDKRPNKDTIFELFDNQLLVFQDFKVVEETERTFYSRFKVTFTEGSDGEKYTQEAQVTVHPVETRVWKASNNRKHMTWLR